MSREEKLEEYRDCLRKRIASCQTCQPWDDGPVWVFGQPTILSEVLDDCGVPQDDSLQEEILANLECPNCGDNLSEHFEVGVKFDFEIAHERAVDLANEKYGEQLKEFAAFLEKYPMLGADHPVGRLILIELKSFPKTRRKRLEKSTWYRARRVKDGREPRPTDLGLADSQAVSSPGRFNHLGQAHWYLADSDATAAMEVVKEDEAIVWMQKWVVEGLERVLDLVVFGPDDPEPVSDSMVEALPLLATAMIFGGHLNQEVDRTANWKPQYFIPIYVADAAKRAGFEAIRFSSSRSYGDPNLVIFNEDAVITADGEPFQFNLGDWARRCPF